MNQRMCPLNAIGRAINRDSKFPIECHGDACAWYNGGTCDVSAIADGIQRGASPFKLRDLGHIAVKDAQERDEKIIDDESSGVTCGTCEFGSEERNVADAARKAGYVISCRKYGTHERVDGYCYRGRKKEGQE